MEKFDLLLNVHSNLEPPKPDGSTYLMHGNYHFYHYGCDGFQDVFPWRDTPGEAWQELACAPSDKMRSVQIVGNIVY